MVFSWNLDRFFDIASALNEGRQCELGEACSDSAKIVINNRYGQALNNLIDVCSIWAPPEKQKELK